MSRTELITDIDIDARIAEMELMLGSAAVIRSEDQYADEKLPYPGAPIRPTTYPGEPIRPTIFPGPPETNPYWVEDSILDIRLEDESGPGEMVETEEERRRRLEFPAMDPSDVDDKIPLDPMPEPPAPPIPDPRR